MTLKDALIILNTGGVGIALLVDESGRLVDTITDGDVRRAILDGCAADSSIAEIEKVKGQAIPTSARVGTSPAELLETMRSKGIRHIPLVDEHGVPLELVTLDSLLDPHPIDLQAVIMAGGFGTRLYPLTESTPKPMLRVGDKPLIEHIVSSLQKAGIGKVNITTHFMSEKISDHFEDGSKFGVEVNYVHEDKPLGTAGSLSLLEKNESPLLVMNGDILTNVNYQALMYFHKKHEAALTICIRQYDVKVPYGVIKCNGEEVVELTEKPTVAFFVNAGIYLLEPSVQTMIPQNERLDMTDLVNTLLSQGKKVVGFPIVEYWLDIGQHADYDRAQVEAESGVFKASH